MNISNTDIPMVVNVPEFGKGYHNDVNFYVDPVPSFQTRNSKLFGKGHGNDVDICVDPMSSFPTKNSKPLDDAQLQLLMKQGFTRGLGMCLNQVKETFALRYWIIDNSGSMQEADGTRLLPAKYRKDPKMVQCTRWEEIKECINYHINLASLIQAPTRFRLLNDPGDAVGPQQFSVAEDTHRMGHDVQEAFSIMRKARPGGCTPLTKHILEIHHEVSQIAPELRKLGKKVAVIIATDSIPSNERGHSGHRERQQFAEALRLLEGLPVWIAVRLCTNEPDVTEYYNGLDHQLESSIEVLNNYYGEALEVKKNNPWINYGLPLHRIREIGFQDRVLDLVDERPLTRAEVHRYCTLFFGGENSYRISDPSLDWKAFLGDIERLLRKESKQWDPMNRMLKSWINTKELGRIHNDNRGTIMKRLIRSNSSSRAQ